MAKIAEQQAKLKGKRKDIKARPIKTQKGLEAQYRKELNKLVRALQEEVRVNIMPLLKSQQKEFIADSIYETVISAIAAIKNKFTKVPVVFAPIVNNMIKKIDTNNHNRTTANINTAIGVDLSSIIQSANLQGILEAENAKNISLIKSIPDEFFKDIETTVLNGMTEGKRFETIAKEISGIKDISSVFGKLEKRAKLIARNEVGNINATLTKKRQEALGISMYEWQTASDERVRESHTVLNGKMCRWDDNTVYSDDNGKTWKKKSSIGGELKHPGMAINCRCTSIPFIKIEED